MRCLVLEAFDAFRGASDGAHGIFLAHGVEAITLGNSNSAGRGEPSKEAATMVEGLFRVLNNMTQRFNQCYYFYIFTGGGKSGLRFVPLEAYIVPVLAFLSALVVGGIAHWVRAGYDRISAKSLTNTSEHSRSPRIPHSLPWETKERNTVSALVVVIGVYGLSLAVLEALPTFLPRVHAQTDKQLNEGCEPGEMRTLPDTLCRQERLDVSFAVGAIGAATLWVSWMRCIL